MVRSFLWRATEGYRLAGGFLDQRLMEVNIMHILIEILHDVVFDIPLCIRQSTRLFVAATRWQ